MNPIKFNFKLKNILLLSFIILPLSACETETTPQTYSVTVISSDTTKGTVTGNGEYKAGDAVTIVASTNSTVNLNSLLKPAFLGWFEDNNCVSSNSTYTFVMPDRNLSYLAKFDDVNKTTGEKLLFGTYPQTKVTDNTLASELDLIAGTLPNSSNSQKWTPYNWYKNSSTQTKFAWYIDLDTNNDGVNDYRGVYFDYYRPNSPSSQGLGSSSYQDDNGFYTYTIHWFKYEPIEWRVLNSVSHDFLLMSNKIIDSQQYSFYSTSLSSNKTDYEGNTESVYPNNYKYSDVRSFLNTNFLNSAFKANETSRILTTNVDNSVSSTGYSPNSYACMNTNDKIFLLSYSEAINSSYGFKNKASRLLKVTDYAACMGCFKSNDNDSSKGCGNWWLRSPHYLNTEYSRYIFNSGADDLYQNVAYSSIGIVPALYLR